MKALAVFASALAVVAAPHGVRAEQPPIIDRNLFFGEAEISGEQISPDGRYISFLKPYKGTRNIWVKTTSEPFSAARPVSAEVKRPTRVADPTTEQGKALLIAESPLARANAIVTPLMVVQGKNDPRVNIRESNQIVAAMRDNGKPVEYLVAPDEGHGYLRPINTLAMVTAMEPFLAKYLGGRYQEDVPADVAAKLKEIWVDPRTVSGAVTGMEPDAAPSK